MSRSRLLALLLALVTLVAYLPATRNGFLYYDDDQYVAANNVVLAGLTPTGVGWAFTTFYFSNWHPLTWLSYMVDCTLFGVNPGAMHFVNALFHAANAVLLFMLLRRLTNKIWPSALVAALFAWHPLHVESVAWIAERKDVLSTFFALLALIAYARFVGEKSRRHYWLAVLCFALGLMAKPMLVTLPCLLLLLDFWPLQRISNVRATAALILEKAPFLLLATASCVVTLFAQRGAMATLERVPFALRLENVLAAYASYLGKIFWPANLAVAYPFAQISTALVLLAGVILLTVSVAAWRGRRTRPFFLVGWCWFLGTLVPVIGLVQVGATAMADRYTYLPAIGIFLAVAFGLDEAAGRWSAGRKIIPALATVTLLACLAVTENQLRYWRDSETLFRHAIAVAKNNDVAHCNLGYASEKQGRSAEALAEFRAALQINPGHYQMRFPIGNMLAQLGRNDEALTEYRECLRRDPKIPMLHNVAGCALAALGDNAAALAELAEAERLEPRYARPHLEAADIFSRQGQITNAVAELWAAVKTEPYNVEILSGAAQRLSASENAAVRDGSSAVVLALKANELASGFQPEVLDVLGMAFAETGDFTNAVASAQNALELAEAGKLNGAEAIHRRLALYQNKQPWRESFNATNAAMKLK